MDCAYFCDYNYRLFFLFFLDNSFFVERGLSMIQVIRKQLKKMVELAQIKPGEKSVDLGSGDGRVVIEFAKKRYPSSRIRD